MVTLSLRCHGGKLADVETMEPENIIFRFFVESQVKKEHHFVQSQVFCRLAKKHFIYFVLDKGQTGKKKDETI
jgi:hypothetical protein